jgi:hypothetical protein
MIAIEKLIRIDRTLIEYGTAGVLMGGDSEVDLWEGGSSHRTQLKVIIIQEVR